MRYEWKLITHAGNETHRSMSLIENLEANKCMFWASIDLEPNSDGKYMFVAWNKNRGKLLTTDFSAPSIEEAQEAIEKFLFDQGVLQEGDEVGHE